MNSGGWRLRALAILLGLALTTSSASADPAIERRLAVLRSLLPGWQEPSPARGDAGCPVPASPAAKSSDATESLPEPGDRGEPAPRIAAVARAESAHGTAPARVIHSPRAAASRSESRVVRYDAPRASASAGRSARRSRGERPRYITVSSREPVHTRAPRPAPEAPARMNSPRARPPDECHDDPWWGRSASATRQRTRSAIRAASRRYGVDSRLIRAVIRHESAFAIDAVSPVGAMGLMQLMPATARMLGVSCPFDPRENVLAGSRYLRHLYDRFSSWPKALAAYNAGPTRVARGSIPEETHRYVDRVMRAWRPLRSARLALD